MSYAHVYANELPAVQQNVAVPPIKRDSRLRFSDKTRRLIPDTTYITNTTVTDWKLEVIAYTLLELSLDGNQFRHAYTHPDTDIPTTFAAYGIIPRETLPVTRATQINSLARRINTYVAQ